MRNMFKLRDGLTGRHVLAALVGFFGLVAVANALFVYYAVGTFNGFETRDAYRRGLTYNERVLAAEAQARLGWQATAVYDPVAGRLRVEVRGPAGAPVAGLEARGRIGRPVTDNEDRELALREGASGNYETQVGLSPGQWILAADLFASSRDSRPAYRMKQRLWVKEGS